jgi:hypothetical protein
MQFVKYSLVALLLVALPASRAAAQQNDRSELPSFEQMQRRMMELQRQMIDELKNSPFFGGDWVMPDSSSFFFRLDTSLAMPGQQFFRLFADPFDGDFFGFDNDPRSFDDGQLPDDGGVREHGDEAEPLPEERLRQQRQNDAGPSGKTTPKSKKTELKTIRI